MATINTNLAGVTSGSQYASAGNNTIYTNLPFNTAGSTTTDVTFFVGASASIDILYNQSFKVDSTQGFHELFGNIEVQGASSDYTVSSWYGKVTLTHKTSGQVISFQLTKPQFSASNSGVNVEFLDGAIAFTSNVNAQGVWTVWATTGGTDTSTWGQGGKASQVPGTYSPGATPLDLSTAASVGFLNYSVNSSDVTDWTGSGSGATYTLTTGVDTFTGTAYDDTFNASLSGGFNTLNTQDQLNGNGGTDTLNATIDASVTPLSLQNIEIINLTNANALARTVGLVNAGQAEEVTNDGSNGALTINGLAASVGQLNVYDTDSATTFNYISTAGTQAVGLTVDNVGVGAAAAVTLNGIETINVVSGDGTSQANNMALTATGANTIDISGASDLTLSLGAGTTSVSLIDGSDATGDLAVALTNNQSGVLSTTAVSVYGGSGDDTLDVSAETTSNVSVDGNDGDDTITVGNNLALTDSIDGGTGTNTLSATFASADAVDGATNQINNIQILELTTALGGALSAVGVDSTIVEVDVAVAGAAAQLNSAASTITGGAGTFTVDLGATAANNDATLDFGLTVTDTGTATTDTLVINNLAVNSTTGANLNVFASAGSIAQNVTSTGYENVEINTGNASPTAQTIGTLTITADTASANTSLEIDGNEAVSIAALTTNSTGLLTVDASGLGVTSTANGLTLSATTSGVAGTQSITGSAGIDTITVGNFASTILGGTGADVITGGTQADSIHGGEGNDVLTGNGGNDTIRGEAGNDTIDATVAGTVSIEGGEGNDTVSMAGTLGLSDVVNGGEGTDTLSVTAAITGTTGVGVSNFEILNTTVSQTLSNTINNSGWTTVFADGAGITISNASTTLTTYQVDASSTGAQELDRLVDTGTNSLTLATTGAAAQTFTMASFTANDEETLTINNAAGAAGTGTMTITTLNGADLQSLTLTGDNAIVITNAIAGANGSLATVDASAMTASANVSVANAAIAVTMTGAAANASTLTGGAGADVITGGSANDSLTGNNGADYITGGAGDDTLLAGQGADTIQAGSGLDAITAGIGADTVTLSVDSATDTITQGAADSIANSSQSFVGANFAAGDTITYGNGVDVINNFAAGAGGDVLVAGTITSQSLLGTTTNVASVGWLSGTYNSATGVFTVAANGVGPDTLVLQAGNVGATPSTNTSAVILVGVDSDNLLNSNFGGSNFTNLTATYAGTNWSVAGQAIQAITVDATSATPNITAEVGASVGYTGTYSPGTVTVITFNGVTGGFGANVNLSGAINAALTQLTGTTGNDTFTYVNEDLGDVVTGVTVTGNGGTDTLALTNVEAAVTLGTGGAGQTAVVDIENLSLTNGTRNLADNATSLVTIANGIGTDLAVSNASATADASVNLGTRAGNSYTSASSGVDTVTLNAAAQSVTTGTGSDTVNLAVAVAQTGAINMGTGGADVLNTTAAGAYDLTGATLTGIDTLATAAGVANTLILSQTNFAAISTAITFGTTADTLVLQDGTYDFSAKTLTFGTAASVLDLDTGSTGSKTLTLDAADVNNVGTITGEATVAAVTTLNFNNAVDLSAVTVTNLDTLTIAGLNQTLTVDGTDFTATNYTTVTGSGTSNLQFGNAAAAVDLTNTSISGFDAVNTDIVGANAVTVDALSFGATAFTWVVDTGGATTLAVASTTDGSNWTIDQSVGNDTFAAIALTDAGAGGANTFTANSTILGTALIAVTATAATTGVNTFVVNAAAAASAIDTSAIATVTNLDAIQLNDGAGANLITTSATDAVRGITSISLANGGTDQVNINNTAVDNGGVADVAITGFTTGAGGDVISSEVGGVSFSDGAFYGNTTGAVALALDNGDIVEINADTVTFGTLTNTAAVLTWLTTNFITANAGGEIATIIAYDGAGTAGIYQVDDTGGTTDFDAIELIGTVNAANNSFVATNFA